MAGFGGEEFEQGLGGNLAQLAPRMFIVDLTSKDKDSTLEAQYNPAELEEELKVEWAKLAVTGLSHRPRHYMGTENAGFAFDLTFDGLVPGMTVPGIMAARRFLRSLCYPKKGARDVRSGQAPRVLFVWPNFLSLTAGIDSLSFKYERFTVDGTPSRYVVKVKLEEIRDARFYSEDVLEGAG